MQTWRRCGATVVALWLLCSGAGCRAVEDVQEWWQNLFGDLEARCGKGARKRRRKSELPQGTAACDNLDRWNYAVSLGDMGRLRESALELKAVVRTDAEEEQAFRFMARRKLAEVELNMGKAAAARKVLQKMLADELDVAQNHTLSVLLRASELALGLQQPSAQLALIDAKHAEACTRFESRYAGWGALEADLKEGIVALPGVPTDEAFAGFVLRRQPFRIGVQGEGTPARKEVAAALRALGLPNALAAFSPAKLAAKAGDELVFAQAVRVSGHKDPGSAARAVFAYENENHRRVFCNFSAVLADIFGAGAVGLPLEQSCLAQRLAQLPPDADASAGTAKPEWRVYQNLQANLLPPPEDGGSYTRPLNRLQKALPKPTLLKRFQLQAVNPWLGRGHVRSQLHHDRADTLYVLLQGWKRFRVWPPSEAVGVKTVHPPRLTSPSGTITYAVAVEHKHILASGEFSHLVRTDLGTGSPFPEAAEELRARGAEVELLPGQALYLPGHWFHEVESDGEGGDGPHVAVSFDVNPPGNLDSRTLQVRGGVVGAGASDQGRPRRNRKRQRNAEL